jgi:cellulose synthase/poly-beta-1,6-N-acetylglucosamine synthase-like glycosyltransferase
MQKPFTNIFPQISNVIMVFCHLIIFILFFTKKRKLFSKLVGYFTTAPKFFDQLHSFETYPESFFASLSFEFAPSVPQLGFHS